MGLKVDIEDLIDSATVAELLGLASRRHVSTYRSRYPDFPAPLLSSDAGRCLLWRRQDVERWARSRSGGSG
jgi:hypothetical protein